MEKFRKGQKVIRTADEKEKQAYLNDGYVKVEGKKPEVKGKAPAQGQGDEPPKQKAFKNQNIDEQTASINACKTVEELEALKADVKKTAQPIFDAKVKELEGGQGQGEVVFKDLSDEDQVKAIEACEKLEDLEALIAQEPKENALKALEAKIDELQK